MTMKTVSGRTVCALALGGAIGLVGCASTPQTTDATEANGGAPPVQAENDDALAGLTPEQKQLLDLATEPMTIAEARPATPAPDPGTAPTASPASTERSTDAGLLPIITLPDDAPQLQPGYAATSVRDPDVAPPVEPPAPVAAPPTTPDRAELAHELGALLRDSAGDPAQAVSALIRLTALDLIEPGVSEAQLVTPDGALAPSEQELVDALRAFFVEAGEALESGDATGSLPLAVESLNADLSGGRTLAINDASLCTSASGFGVYEAFPSYDGVYKLVGGRAHRLVVYNDLEHFSTTKVHRNGRDGHEVLLTQELSLYHFTNDKDTLAWRKPAQEVRDFCSVARRDFYLAHLIELPSTLSVGSYRLKIGVTDRATGQRAEAVIPIEVVGHSSAMTLTK